MIEYLGKNYDKLLLALLEHLEIVAITLLISIILAALLTIFAMYSKILQKIFTNLFSVIYSVPSLALFAILIPLTGLGKWSAIIVLILYNQYILLRNFIDGLNQVDKDIIEAALGMGMRPFQIIFKVRVPLSIKPIFTGMHLAIISTIGIATIAAAINAGGLGSILFDGLRTMNVNKILAGSILSAGLAILVNGILSKFEERFERKNK